MPHTQPVTKAIICVAGYGTRRLPITKAVEKCMIPVGNRPIVDYAVENCIKAGITDIIFVVGEQSEQIRTYYGRNQALEAYLVAQQKTAALDSLSDLEAKAVFHFVTQDREQPYGTSVPIWLARDYIQPGEQFLFMYGDNLFYQEDGNAVADFLHDIRGSGANCAMMVNEVPYDTVSRYGIVATETRGAHEFFQYIKEKPAADEAPSNLNNSGCFLLSSDIFTFVERSMHEPDPTLHEHLFTDPINWYHDAGHDIAVGRLKGEYLDCGSLEGWLYANNRVVGAQTTPLVPTN
ncbi:MAG TPA: sugar phosphate nucleotidyltransferase [Bacillota bacterium]|nr:sugar phosphate nucleotidyltransferase [Bacillota bacterium]